MALPDNLRTIILKVQERTGVPCHLQTSGSASNTSDHPSYQQRALFRA